MGSWYETCGLTKLPMMPREKVALYVVVGGLISDHVYINDTYNPMCLPIYGEYDDYGGIENVENPEVLDLLFNHIKSEVEAGRIHVQPSRDGADEYGWDKEKNLKTPKDLLDCIERGYLTTPSWNGKETLEISYMMMHREALQVAIDNFGSRVPYKEETTLREQYGFIVDRDTKVLVESRAKYDEMKEKIGDGKGKAKDGGDLPEDLVKKLYETTKNLNIGDKYCKVFDGYNTYDMTYIIEGYCNTEDAKLREALVDHLLVNSCFHYSRIEWRPHAGKGSQGQEYDVHLDIWKVGEKIANARYDELLKDVGDTMTLKEVEEQYGTRKDVLQETMWSPIR